MAVRKLKVSMQQLYLSGKLKTDDTLDWLFYKKGVFVLKYVLIFFG
jgi:hypothetical protein